jgi:hypothetical protein
MKNDGEKKKKSPSVIKSCINLQEWMAVVVGGGWEENMK